jgi:hypothetical protein
MFSNPATALARVNVKAMDFLLGRNRNFLFGRDTLRFLVIAPVFWVLYWRRLTKDFLRGKPFQTIRYYGKNARGMSFWRDLIDWVGGYPFEVATPEQIFDFYRERGFLLTRLHTCGGGLGCNQFVFEKKSES